MAVYSKTFINDSCKRLMLLSYKKLREIVTRGNKKQNVAGCRWMRPGSQQQQTIHATNDWTVENDNRSDTCNVCDSVTKGKTSEDSRSHQVGCWCSRQLHTVIISMYIEISSCSPATQQSLELRPSRCCNVTLHTIISDSTTGWWNLRIIIITSDKGGNVFARVCLSVGLFTRLLKNVCLDLDEMLRVERCRDSCSNFWARSRS